MKGLVIFVFCMMINFAFAENDLGKTTYEIACQNCHAPKLASAIKAPAAFDKKAWKQRLKQASLGMKTKPNQFKTPMDYLLYNVKIGKGLMHHKGLCNEADVPNKNCSDEALIQAIHYMGQF